MNIRDTISISRWQRSLTEDGAVVWLPTINSSLGSDMTGVLQGDVLETGGITLGGWGHAWMVSRYDFK